MAGRKIFVYRDSSSNLKFGEIKDFLEQKLKNLKNTEIQLRGDFFSYFLKSSDKKVEETAKKIASARVFDIRKQKNEKETEPFYAEIELEKKALNAPEKRVSGVLYDGFLLKDICYGIIPENEKKLNVAHIIFLNRLLGTFDEGDRYHARAIILGSPSLISAQGMVEAPAKPKEYYLIKTTLELPPEILKSKFEGRFLEHSDERLTEAAKGYALQALFYQLFGEAFCEDKSCRLYNAHYQEELINSQLKSRKQDLCKKHADFLKIY